MTCGQKRERKDLQAFKDSLTHTSMMEMKQHKTQSQAAKKTSEQNEEMKRKLDALRAECEEIKARNRELMLVTMNLKDNPCVVSAWSKLHPIQDLYRESTSPPTRFVSFVKSSTLVAREAREAWCVHS